MSVSRAITVGLGLFACTSSANLAAAPTVCELAQKRGGLTMYAVDVNPDQNGNREVHADIDGDGSVDQISWFDPGSGSVIPADNSTLTITLTSSGKTFTLEQQRLHVVRHQSNYFVVAGWVESERGPWHRDVYALDRTGINKVCSFSGKGLGQ